MAEPPSSGRGAASPERELFCARPGPDAKASRGSQPASKKLKGADERGLKGARRVNGEGGGGGGSSKQQQQPLPAAVPSYGNPAAWGFAALPPGPSVSAAGFAFPSPLPRKLLPPALLLPPAASPSPSCPQHRHHRHRPAPAGEAAKPKRPKEKRDKERRKHGALPALGDGGGGALSAAGREENGEVKLLLQKAQIKEKMKEREKKQKEKKKHKIMNEIKKENGEIKLLQKAGKEKPKTNAEELQIKKVKKKKKKKHKENEKRKRPKMYSKSIQTICSGLVSDVEDQEAKGIIDDHLKDFNGKNMDPKKDCESKIPENMKMEILGKKDIETTTMSNFHAQGEMTV